MVVCHYHYLLLLPLRFVIIITTAEVVVPACSRPAVADGSSLMRRFIPL